MLADAIRRRGLDADAALLAWLVPLSARLADVRGPAFHQEIAVAETDAREAVDAAERILALGQELLERLRRS